MGKKIGKKKTVIEVSYSDLEKLVKKHYPEQYKHMGGYSFAAVEECGNDTSHGFDVDGKLDDWDLEKFAKGEASNIALLNKLCADGLIEAGEYLIEVCW